MPERRQKPLLERDLVDFLKGRTLWKVLESLLLDVEVGLVVSIEEKYEGVFVVWG
ncbi:hypothetical protein HanIR_Chr16g0823951 [Helianthus annuus]|nr:hypothetical protein HanIR_Chr16g0823951 [Helianthus annuus]